MEQAVRPCVQSTVRQDVDLTSLPRRLYTTILRWHLSRDILRGMSSPEATRSPLSIPRETRYHSHSMDPPSISTEPNVRIMANTLVNCALEM